MVSKMKLYLAGAIGIIGMIGAIYVTLGGIGTAGPVNPLLALTGAGIGGASYGWYQHISTDRENDEREMAINYRAGYVGFWAVYWFLFPFVLAGVREVPSGGMNYELPIDAYPLVLTAWVLGTVVIFVTRFWYKRQF